MYSDGHEQENVVEYRRKFVEWFKEYECRFHTWNDKGNELMQPSGFLVPGAIGWLCLILVTTMSGHLTKITNAKSIRAAQAKM